MCKFRTLEAREIECRVATAKFDADPRKAGVSLLLYKDARCDMNILDETIGSMNWKRSHTRDNANCIVSIWDAEKKEWISKEDTGTESNTEAEKGLASDSFKRACFNWGIGRELYTAPFIWIDGTKCKVDAGNGKSGKCYDRFAVKEIGYNDHREINRLVIVNEKTRVVVFRMGEAPENEPQEPTPADAMKQLGTAKDSAAYILPFGEYAGMTLGDVFKQNRKYVINLYSDRNTPAETRQHVYTVLNAAKAAMGK